MNYSVVKNTFFVTIIFFLPQFLSATDLITIYNQGGIHSRVTVNALNYEDLTILSGFSPNGDGINDTFTILGVHSFPNNTLTIFNKWGEQIFYKKGYQNDWNGEAVGGKSLASKESIYYYVFDTGEGKSFSGYLQIREDS